MKAIEDLFAKDKKLAEFVADPSVQRIVKRDALTGIFQKQKSTKKRTRLGTLKDDRTVLYKTRSLSK